MSLRMFSLSAALVASCLSVAPAALREPQGGVSSSNAAQAPARSTAAVLDTLDRVRAFHETAISPDGRRVAWVEAISIAEGSTAIYMRTLRPPADLTKPAFHITASNDGRGHKEDGVAWASDGRTVAFLSDSGTPSQQQLYDDPAVGAPGERARRALEVRRDVLRSARTT